MPERDYANELDEWLRQTGGDTGYGGTIPSDPPYGQSVSVPLPSMNPSNASVPGNQWGVGPDDNVGNGMDRDLWYWLTQGVPASGPNGIFDNNGQLRPGWARTGRGYERVGGGGTTTGGDGGTTGGYNGPTFGTTVGRGGGAFASSGFGWPTYSGVSYDAPEYLDQGAFDPGPAFTYADFAYRDFDAPTAADMANEPGFQFRLDQGRKALESSAAGRGTLRSGGTLKDILGYGQNFASQEYGNVYNRALREYDTNRSNAFSNYQTGRQNAWDTWNTGYQGRRDAFGFHADDVGRHNQFNQNNALNNFNARNSNAQFDFNARQRQAESEFDDAFRRWAKEGDWIVGSAD